MQQNKVVATTPSLRRLRVSSARRRGCITLAAWRLLATLTGATIGTRCDGLRLRWQLIAFSSLPQRSSKASNKFPLPRLSVHMHPTAPALATRRLLVVGDVMLDRYWF